MDERLLSLDDGRQAGRSLEHAMSRLSNRSGPPAGASESSPAGATAKDAGARRNWYLAYTRWRIGHLRHESVTYFRDSPHRSLIWFMVMRGYYDGAPPSLQDCIAASLCSIGTARAIITTAEAKRYFRFVSDPNDSRKRRIAPTAEVMTATASARPRPARGRTRSAQQDLPVVG